MSGELPLPHAGPARLVHEVLEREAGQTTCRARIPAASPLLCGSSAPAWVALEIGAQAAAASLSRPQEGSEPREGFLVGVREADFLVDSLPVETDLRIRVRLEGAAPPLAVHSFELLRGDRPLARGTLSTHVGG